MLDVDDERLAIEAISKLVWWKADLVRLVLVPAGLHPAVARKALDTPDMLTGQKSSKRHAATILLEDLREKGEAEAFVRRVIEIAGTWTNFALAKDEFDARAVVQKARARLGTLRLMEEREAKQRELAKREELERLEAEQARLLRRNCALHVAAFDELAQSSDFQSRGYGLQDLLGQVMDSFGLPVERPFARNAGGEQIDGGFVLGSWRFLVECRWRGQLDNIRDLDGLEGQVSRSGKAAYGLYLSINGWSKNVEPLLKQSATKSVLLMNGYDLRCVLDEVIDLRKFLEAKVNHHSFRGEPYLSAREFAGQSLVAS